MISYLLGIFYYSILSKKNSEDEDPADLDSNYSTDVSDEHHDSDEELTKLINGGASSSKSTYTAKKQAPVEDLEEEVAGLFEEAEKWDDASSSVNVGTMRNGKSRRRVHGVVFDETSSGKKARLE